MMIIDKWLVDILGFSKSEAKGTVTLIIIVLLTTIVPKAWYYFRAEYSSLELDNQQELDQWSKKIDAKITSIEKSEVEKKSSIEKKHSSITNAHNFDPNTVTEDELIKMGLEDKLAARIVKYTSKGGKFFDKEDLKKIYGLSSTTYDQLAPFIHIKKEEKKYIREEKKTFDKPVVKFDINNADTTQLQLINGIGDKLSKRIISYRDLLGGFYSLSQLQEVYGLDSAVISRMEDRLVITQNISGFPVNTDSIKHLAQHPYISYKLAKAIVNYRKTHGNYTDLETLKLIKILDSATYAKILPYLRLNP
ncbi:MAG: helix-hairpin-helix domain-containing protein [Cyclobacteriaceae bacterium]